MMRFRAMSIIYTGETFGFHSSHSSSFLHFSSVLPSGPFATDRVVDLSTKLARSSCHSSQVSALFFVQTKVIKYAGFQEHTVTP